ncbi:MAG: radical SAM protein [Lachnospiraceae bacterium]|nr:radical SAM protein [Lachnospiraceae bacterium]
MHFTGTIWRPPYEANSLLIEVTAGCTHHKCKFCTLYDDLPFKFRMTPMEDVEADLAETQTQLRSWQNRQVKRVYLVGANPFVLKFERLKKIANLIHKYFPECETIGCFSRVTDITLKTDEQLRELHRLGYDGLTIGVETGDDVALAFMNKGYQAQEIVKQTHRLDKVNITYNYFYLTGVSGAGHGVEGALESAKIFNMTHPKIIGSSMLTIFPESELYQEIQDGNWAEEGELEKLQELKALIEHLDIPTFFASLGASNAVYVQGNPPKDKKKMVAELEKVCNPDNEAALRHYRTNLQHL